MSAATIDRALRTPRSATRQCKRRPVVPEPRRRVRMRTFAEWNDPLPGSMQMDLVAHCGDVNRGSYIHSLVMTDIASGWTEAVPTVAGTASSRPCERPVPGLLPTRGVPQHQLHTAVRRAVRAPQDDLLRGNTGH